MTSNVGIPQNSVESRHVITLSSMAWPQHERSQNTFWRFIRLVAGKGIPRSNTATVTITIET